MTKMDVYTSALDRQVITNSNWRNTKCRYIKIGNSIWKDDIFPTEINILDEPKEYDWYLLGQVTRWYKFKMQLRILSRVWSKIK